MPKKRVFTLEEQIKPLIASTVYDPGKLGIAHDDGYQSLSDVKKRALARESRGILESKTWHCAKQRVLTTAMLECILKTDSLEALNYHKGTVYAIKLLESYLSSLTAFEQHN